MNWSEIWYFRDLFYFLTWRDLKVKYKQTIIGVFWAVFQPLITMIIFSIFFGHYAKLPSDGIPYPLFAYAGLLFWTLFSTSISAVSDSFIVNERIVTKVYFPRIIMPISSIITNVVDFLIASIVLITLMAYYHFPPHLLGIALLPLLLLMTIISILGIGLLFSSLNVKYRDVRYILPFFIQLLIFVTPVIYPASIVLEKYRWILGLNPMAGVIDTARASLLGTHPVDWMLLAVSSVSMIIYCFIGYMYFKKTERYFADVI